MMKEFMGPGGPYLKEVDLGPNPYESKMLTNPFNTTQWNKDPWDKPEMRNDYREVNTAYESLSPKEFAGAGELFADKKYAEETGQTTEIDPFKTAKKGSVMENFGMKDGDSDDKESKKRKKLESMG